MLKWLRWLCYACHKTKVSHCSWSTGFCPSSTVGICRRRFSFEGDAGEEFSLFALDVSGNSTSRTLVWWRTFSKPLDLCIQNHTCLTASFTFYSPGWLYLFTIMWTWDPVNEKKTLYFYETFSWCVFKCKSLFSFQFPYFTKPCSLCSWNGCIYLIHSGSKT